MITPVLNVSDFMRNGLDEPDAASFRLYIGAEAALTFSGGLLRTLNQVGINTGTSLTWSVSQTFAASATNFGSLTQSATLQQVAPSIGAGNDFAIAASAAASGNTNGGKVVLKPGLRSGSGSDGVTSFLAPGGTIGNNDLQVSVSGTTVTMTVAPSAGSGQNFILTARDSKLQISDAGQGFFFLIAASRFWIIDNSRLRAGSGMGIGWSSNTDPGIAVNDSGFARAAAGSVKVTNGSTGDGSFIALKGIGTLAKAGTPTDSDVTNPTDGMLAVDTTNNKIYARIGGAWKGVTVS